MAASKVVELRKHRIERLAVDLARELSSKTYLTVEVAEIDSVDEWRAAARLAARCSVPGVVERDETLPSQQPRWLVERGLEEAFRLVGGEGPDHLALRVRSKCPDAVVVRIAGDHDHRAETFVQPSRVQGGECFTRWRT
ncbi:MAG: hypothetical protein WD225_11230 [Ilumatobacteraceae bacterium]